jgi:4-amino-4-deoxy-L-arabinose transferase-like glycosyltransferase
MRQPDFQARTGDAALRVAMGCGLLLIAFALFYRLGSPVLFEDPNDGQYAEVAREMIESGDWISPQLNYVLFLNKPPLTYWLVASAYAGFGVNEFAARLPGVLVTLLTLLLIYRLGGELFDPLTGLLAVFVYAGMPSTLVEARMIRPDSILTATTLGALLAFAVALRSTGSHQRRALYGLQLALAAGLLDKGIVALLLPAFPIAVIITVERRWDLLRVLAAPRSWVLFAMLVIPWHLVASLRHTGFAWDYIVNQHLLFFFDRKLTRDSTPVPLTEFWGAFLARSFPWVLFLPIAVVSAWCHRRSPETGRPAGILLLAWAGGVLGFFSFASSRLEHYSLPALPAIALMVGHLLRTAAEPGPTWRRFIFAHLVVLALVLATGFWGVPRLLESVEWLAQCHDLTFIARAFFATLSTTAVVALIAMRRQPLAIAPLFTAITLLIMPLVHRGLVAIAPVNSSAPTADLLRDAIGDAPAEIVFEAPTEYQLVAGLNFYLRRRITLLRPPGFVDPPYLRPYSDGLFIDRAELADLWQSTRLFFVSDPLAPSTRTIREIVPEPYYVLAHTTNRWIVSNRPLP